MKRLFLTPVLFGACLAMVFGLIIPQFQEYQHLKNSLVLAQNILDKNDLLFAELHKIKSELSEKEDGLQKIESALPDEFSLPDLFYYLQSEIESSGLLLKGIGLQEQREQVSGGPLDVETALLADGEEVDFKSYFVSINAIGSLAALESFFNVIEKSSRLIFLESLHSGVGSEEMPSFALVLKVYSK